jgi:hypothetical protein
LEKSGCAEGLLARAVATAAAADVAAAAAGDAPLGSTLTVTVCARLADARERVAGRSVERRMVEFERMDGW